MSVQIPESVETMASRRPGRPRLYPQLLERLVAFLDEQALPAGSVLESEKQLSQRFGVSRPLIRRALTDLAGQGRIISLPGKGHFIADPPGAVMPGTILCLLGATRYSAIWQDSHVAAIVEGLEVAVGGSSHRLLFELAATYQGNKKDSLAVPLENCRGVILVPLADQAVEPLLEAIPPGVPCVIVGRPSPDPRYPAVVVDHQKGTCQAITHLLQHGHRRIGLVTSQADMWPLRQREQAYQRTLQNAGCFDPTLRLELPERSSFPAPPPAEKLIALNERCTALFIIIGTQLAWVCQSLADHALTPGQDVSLVAYDDVLATRLAVRPITAVRQPTFELGQRAGGLLLEQIEDRQEKVAPIWLETELIVRESVVVVA